MLQFDRVSLTYGAQKILNDISFEIQEGQFAVFIGPSGCGKTTTLKIINRLIQPDSGRICLNGRDIAAMDRYELRRHTGYVIQQIGLFPNMTVAQNICVVPKLLKWPRDKCDQIVHDLLDMVDLPYDQYAHKYPGEMSGGQQQRLCIARALAVEPKVLLMDEPTSALDPISTSKIEELAMGLKEQYTIIIVTHNMQQAARISDYTAFFLLGELIEYGETEKLFSRPECQKTEDYITGRFG